MTFEEWWEENKDRISHLDQQSVIKYFAETAYRTGFQAGREYTTMEQESDY